MKRVLVFFIVAVVFFGACSTQSANAQSANNERRIIGTWVATEGDTWVFNANGTLTLGSEECKFAVIDTRLVTTNTAGGDLIIYDISISSDGRTLILVLVGSNTIRSDIPFGLAIVLTKE